MCYPKKACKPWISTISLSQNCATTRKIKRLWPNLISYEGGQDTYPCQIPNFRPFLPYVLQKMFWNLRFCKVNCAKIRKINRTWCKSNWFRMWSGYIIPNFRPLLCVPQKCLWRLRQRHKKNRSTEPLNGAETEANTDINKWKCLKACNCIEEKKCRVQ